MSSIQIAKIYNGNLLTYQENVTEYFRAHFLWGIHQSWNCKIPQSSGQKNLRDGKGA